MSIHELAGQPAPHTSLINVADLVTRYFVDEPDASAPTQRISFGTSGHRGSSLTSSFNEAHIIAICAALVEHRRDAGITGPLFIGRDTHALSEAAYATAIEVLAAHDVRLVIDSGSRYTPTPVISHAVLKHNRAQGGSADSADGIVITPSHNPPADRKSVV